MIFTNNLFTLIPLLFQSNLFVSMLWIVAAFILLFVETALPGFFFFISFACGCFVASLCALFHAPFSWQLIAWLISTAISFLILKRFGKKAHPHHYHSNYDALIGKRGIVTHEITPLKAGRVKIRGESWAAAAHNETIPRGAPIRVLDVKGNKVIVQSGLSKDSS